MASEAESEMERAGEQEIVEGLAPHRQHLAKARVCKRKCATFTRVRAFSSGRSATSIAGRVMPNKSRNRDGLWI